MSALQEVFDKATTALLLQGRKCSDGAGCMYRLPDGRKCAIGHLISDKQIEIFNVRMNQPVYELSDILLMEIIPDNDLEETKEFLDALQVAHDGSDPTNFEESFRNKANDVAYKYLLNPIKVQT